MIWHIWLVCCVCIYIWIFVDNDPFYKCPSAWDIYIWPFRIGMGRERVNIMNFAKRYAFSIWLCVECNADHVSWTGRKERGSDSRGFGVVCFKINERIYEVLHENGRFGQQQALMSKALVRLWHTAGSERPAGLLHGCPWKTIWNLLVPIPTVITEYNLCIIICECTHFCI